MYLKCIEDRRFVSQELESDKSTSWKTKKLKEELEVIRNKHIIYSKLAKIKCDFKILNLF